ncbi:hypothetical protein [Pelagimonas varians]|uniref:Nodulation protein Z (NodZ) n=1 Tax=Pelagimonas varians TaxID=696760 RepID=A0A238K6K9_9RHOB|nr:hypothetical protein [Pelagimonas varians]PYG31858.1 hypothetical protein C8N36_104281 [Pelagimonas varians]SMX38499.1 Nodulation protein Z (NodZ) [Pelagimonas varians]
MNESHNTKRLRLRAGPSGIFSNVNEVIEQGRLAQLGGYSFFIDWSVSCYRDADREEDPWAYYFEPSFPDVTPFEGADDLPGGIPICCTRENVITPRLEDGNCNPLLLPRDRAAASRLLHTYVRPKQYIKDAVAAFKADHWRSKMIGLHIRGPGRLDGGADVLRKALGAEGAVPFQPFFEHTDRILDLIPDAGIFVCSDSQPVIDRVRDRYGDRVVDYPAIRSTFGEMHARHPENGDETFPTYRLGLDMVIEALLLAETDVFIHGNSNVANFVLSYDPYQMHVYVLA